MEGKALAFAKSICIRGEITAQASAPPFMPILNMVILSVSGITLVGGAETALHFII